MNTDSNRVKKNLFLCWLWKKFCLLLLMFLILNTSFFMIQLVYMCYNSDSVWWFSHHWQTFLFQVHTLYQTCSPSDSNLCICAVMVRVGDDSLTIDKCRRSGQTGAVAPSALFYKSGQIAEGFRIYVANDGQIVRVSTF